MDDKIRKLVIKLEREKRRAERELFKMRRQQNKVTKDCQRGQRAAANSTEDVKRMQDCLSSAQFKIKSTTGEEEEWLTHMMQERDTLDSLEERLDALEKRKSIAIHYVEKKVHEMVGCLISLNSTNSRRECDLYLPDLTDMVEQLQLDGVQDDEELTGLNVERVKINALAKWACLYQVYPLEIKKDIVMDARKQKKELMTQVVKLRMERHSLETRSRTSLVI